MEVDEANNIICDLFSCSEVEEIKNNQFYLKIHIPTENVYFFAHNKGLLQPAKIFIIPN